MYQNRIIIEIQGLKIRFKLIYSLNIYLMKTFNLSPIDGRASMANQHVNLYEVNGQTVSDLISYTSRVASYNHATNEIKVFNVPNVLSNTTLRHIKAFFHYYGFDVPTKQELKSLYNL